MQLLVFVRESVTVSVERRLLFFVLPDAAVGVGAGFDAERNRPAAALPAFGVRAKDAELRGEEAAFVFGNVVEQPRRLDSEHRLLQTLERHGLDLRVAAGGTDSARQLLAVVS